MTIREALEMVLELADTHKLSDDDCDSQPDLLDESELQAKAIEIVGRYIEQHAAFLDGQSR